MILDALLTSAFVFLALGLAIFFWTATKAGARNFHRTLVVVWLLFALFAALVLYKFFPTDQASGTLFGLSVTGAVAVFLVIWSLGPRWSMRGESLDLLQAKIEQLEKDKKALVDAPGKRVPQKLPYSKTLFKLASRKTKGVGIVTGNLGNVKDIDLWVNSENNYMQMARFFEGNISGTIRYLGATKDKFEDVEDDVIANALKNEMGAKMTVQPAAIIETTSGELLKTHGVKRILHVAAVRGQAQAGFVPIENLGDCVCKVLDRGCAQDGCRSILIPLLASGTAKASVTDIANALIPAAIAWLEASAEGGIAEVYFLAWSDVDRDVCVSVLEKSEKVVMA